MAPVEIACDALVCGATTGGVPAALALAEAGWRVVLTDHTDWLGGQLTSQAVPPDEHRWIESHGRTQSFARFRRAVRDWYRTHRPLTEAARDNDLLNPGNGWVSRLCFEPEVGHRVLLEWLQPHLASGRVVWLARHEPVAAERHGDRIAAVTLRSLDDASLSTVRPRLVLDATDTGDLLELGQVGHRIGAEHRDEFGEMHAREDRADRFDQQACSWCFALTHDPDADHTIDRPAVYDTWRAYQPDMAGRPEENWTTPLFSWTVPSHSPAGRITFPFIPWPDECPPGVWDMWRYRRQRDAALYREPGLWPDVCLVNWVQMDYWLKPLLGVPRAERDAALEGARQLSLSFLYWMQTEAPRHDSVDRTGYPGLRLAPEITGSPDGLAKSVYIREPRRLIARTTLTEAHLGFDQRTAAGAPGMDATDFGSGHRFPDSVGVGHYHIDLHPSTAMRNSVYVPCCPYRIPLGALIPLDTENLVAAGKCLGVTHVANGTTRMHPTEWNIGEAAGHLAAMCLADALTPAQVHESPALIGVLQERLARAGVEMRWPWEHD